MPTFTVHVPPPSGAGDVAPDRIVLLRDGFSWPAFLFGPLWLAWRRAWIPALGWTLALILASALAKALHFGNDSLVWMNLAMGLALGFEGTRLVAWSLGRKGYREKTLVIGDDLDQAEEVFFSQWRGGPDAGEQRA